MRKKYLKTISSKVTIAVILLSIIFSIIISIVFYNNFKKLLMTNMVEVTDAHLRLVMDSLDEQLKQVRSIVEWGVVNSNLSDILILDYSNKLYDKQVFDFLDKITSTANSSTVGDYIDKLLVYGNQGFTVQLGKSPGHVSDVEACNNTEWFSSLLNHKKLEWMGLVENPFKYGNAKYILPTAKPVYSYTKRGYVGWLMMGIDSDVAYDYINKYATSEDSEVIIFNKEGQIISHNNKKMISDYLENIDSILENIGSNREGSFLLEKEKEFKTAVYYQSEVTNWYILKTLSSLEIKKQQQVFLNIIISTVVVIIVLGSCLSLLLTYFINKSTRAINSKIKKIAKGDFSFDKTIESEDEIGRIGKVINQMTSDIRRLMDEVVDNEKAKRELELKVLQTQVNPHFLYNTLNSVKWMAVIQKTTGISEIVTALSRLLKNMAKGVSKEISLEEELSLVNDYILIQKMRYSNSFEVVYDIEEHIKHYKIIKFTIQPLVENAIFHGIEPKIQSGEIKIRVWKQEQSIAIAIKDNGVGMSQEIIKRILKDHKNSKADGLTGIGISNVNERLKLTYGASYGLTIKSQEGQFTEVIIKIPLNV